MKKIFLASLAVGFLLGGTVGVASATIMGSLWNGVPTNSSTSASYLTANSGDMQTTLGSPTDTFTVDQINFYSASGAPVASYQEFLGGPLNVNNLNWLTGTNETTLISTNSTTSAFFQFKGTAYFENGDAIIHDDGAFLQLLTNNVVQYTFDFSTPTSPKTDYISGLASAGAYDFVLNYSAWNGDPEVLQTRGVDPVPEPATMILFGTGLAGLAGLNIRRKK